jgi:23S rRNA A1618 N6-methylase RlmF
LRKRLERERKRHREVIDTPRRKNDSLMRKTGLKLGTRATESIRKKLLYAECISKEATEASEVNPAKKRLVEKVSGKIMKKYKMLTELKQSTNITWRTQAKQLKKLDQERQHRNLFLRHKNCQRCFFAG